MTHAIDIKTIDQHGDWRQYAPTLPPRTEPVGVAELEDGRVGALVRRLRKGRASLYAAVVGGDVIDVDGRLVAAILGLGGRPKSGPELHRVQIRLAAEDIDKAKRLGGGSVSAGVRVALKKA